MSAQILDYHRPAPDETRSPHWWQRLAFPIALCTAILSLLASALACTLFWLDGGPTSRSPAGAARGHAD